MTKVCCDQCAAKYKVAESSLGKKAKCVKCGAVFVLQLKGSDDGTFAIADDFDMGDAVSEAADRAARSSARAGFREGSSGPPVPCPACEEDLPAGSRICISCGINIKSGRSILISQETNLDEAYMTAESAIRVLSWLMWTGVYPIASEALGMRKPYATRGIAILTIITSFWFLAYEWTESPKMWRAKNYMLWSGDAEPSADELADMYTFTYWGNSEAFGQRVYEVEAANPEMDGEAILRAAHASLPVDEQVYGKYRSSQLVTHAFLHGGIVHLAGNLLFLLIFGARVNTLIGNAATLVLYPILAIGAGVAHMWSLVGESPSAMLGGSGAIMGLAGMYLVFFPAHKVHMAAWARWGLFAGFHLSLRIWPVRGVWVVLFYIAFDVLFTALGVQDGTAHWAHLGGFILGIALALFLLVTRLVNCRGGDLFSWILGKWSWGIVGRPRHAGGLLQQIP